jgi:hypothetical protein
MINNIGKQNNVMKNSCEFVINNGIPVRKAARKEERREE